MSSTSQTSIARRLLRDLLSRSPRLLPVLESEVNRARGLAWESYDLGMEAANACAMLPTGSGEAVVVDAGANSGEFSRALLALAGDRIGTLLMVEPDVSHAEAHQVVCRQVVGVAATEWVALGSEAGVMDLHFDSQGSGLASIYQRDVAHHGLALTQSKQIKVARLDDIVAARGLDRIDFLKLDLEGHELAALEGAMSLLRSASIRCIQFEFGGCNIDSRTFLRDFWHTLHDRCGYSLWRLLPLGKVMPISRYSEDLERFAWQNLIACAPGVSAPGG